MKDGLAWRSGGLDELHGLLVAAETERYGGQDENTRDAGEEERLGVKVKAGVCGVDHHALVVSGGGLGFREVGDGIVVGDRSPDMPLGTGRQGSIGGGAES